MKRGSFSFPEAVKALPWTLALAVAGGMVLLRWGQWHSFAGDLNWQLWLGLVSLLFLVGGLGLGWLVFRKTMRPTENRPQISAQDLLSDREAEVLALLAQGLSNREMAERLFVSENTIKKHLANLYLKLDVQRRTQALSVARQRGLIS